MPYGYGWFVDDPLAILVISMTLFVHDETHEIRVALNLNLTGLVGGHIPSEDVPHATTQQVLPRASGTRGPDGLRQRSEGASGTREKIQKGAATRNDSSGSSVDINRCS